MRYLLISGLVFVFSCARQANNRVRTIDSLGISGNNHSEEIIRKLQGMWTHMEDSLAVVEISGDEWTFKYLVTEIEDNDRYAISITDTLPAFVDKKVKADFILLSNSSDTLHYEVIGLTNDIMSLMYYPRGNTHVYRKLK